MRPLFSPSTRTVLEILNGAGYEAYVVGGAVRDMLIGREPKEFDVCTDACPTVVQELAAAHNIRSYRKGVAFGVISWFVGGEEIEIATFRTELYGVDSHRPEKVEFVWALEDDLARRDFTVNAMAMNLDARIIDPFGGQKAIREGIVEAVGDPEERFAEDALRMFRGCRFIAEYGFRFEERTKAAISTALWRIKGLSVERVRSELEKILVAPSVREGMQALLETGLLSTTCRSRGDGAEADVDVLPELVRLTGVAQNPRYHRSDVWGHTLEVVANIPAVPVLRWAALLHDVAKGLPGVRGVNKDNQPTDYSHARVGGKMALEALNRLKVSPSVATRAAWLVANHMGFPANTEESVVKWLRKFAPDFKNKSLLAEAVDQLLELRRADTLGAKVDPDPVLEETARLALTVADVLTRIPFYPDDLAISGGEVAKAVGCGPQVKQVLEDILLRVQKGQLANQDEALRKAVGKKILRLGH